MSGKSFIRSIIICNAVAFLLWIIGRIANVEFFIEVAALFAGSGAFFALLVIPVILLRIEKNQETLENRLKVMSDYLRTQALKKNS